MRERTNRAGAACRTLGIAALRRGLRAGWACLHPAIEGGALERDARRDLEELAVRGVVDLAADESAVGFVGAAVLAALFEDGRLCRLKKVLSVRVEAAFIEQRCLRVRHG